MPVVAIWTGVCVLLAIVGFATLVSQPSGNGDVLGAVGSPGLTNGDVAAIAFVLWLAGVALVGVVVAARRLSRKTAGTSYQPTPKGGS
jgi:hypothetical protein